MIVNSDISTKLPSSRTYELYMSSKDGSLDLRGFVDELGSMEQAIYLLLNTQRLQSPIYSENYGVEFLDLFGEPMYWVVPELERRITEALLKDQRILEVSDFSSEVEKHLVKLAFHVKTIFGDLNMSKEVDI